jgi:hypothetical protein
MPSRPGCEGLALRQVNRALDASTSAEGAAVPIGPPPLRREQWGVVSPSALDGQQVLDRLSSLRQHQQDGRRSPHKPLLVLLALGRLAETGSSRLPWSEAEKSWPS